MFFGNLSLLVFIFIFQIFYQPTDSQFNVSSSWNAINVDNIDGLNTVGYFGAVFDGQRFIYFVPYRNSALVYHGRVLRYDTNRPFNLSSSWNAFDANNTDGLKTIGY